MGRGVSAGGGKSSLGYLFGDSEAEPKKTVPAEETPKPNNVTNPSPSTAPTATAYSTNNYFRSEGQNCGNFLTDKPTTKVHAAPGGKSSLNYLFGDGTSSSNTSSNPK